MSNKQEISKPNIDQKKIIYIYKTPNPDERIRTPDKPIHPTTDGLPDPVTPDRPTRTVSPNAPPRPRRPRDWYGEVGMCEVCGMREATENLDLRCGSHRECFSCWTD